jgi:hypothetical protein
LHEFNEPDVVLTVFLVDPPPVEASGAVTLEGVESVSFLPVFLVVLVPLTVVVVLVCATTGIEEVRTCSECLGSVVEGILDRLAVKETSVELF